jgi:hypothetical protein
VSATKAQQKSPNLEKIRTFFKLLYNTPHHRQAATLHIMLFITSHPIEQLFVDLVLYSPLLFHLQTTIIPLANT